ncbi:helix-turn-helix transcriptional regulator [Peribacillus simplex]|nr:helix-turn-helix transcriptional regulator [Bacillus sp. CFBP 13597]
MNYKMFKALRSFHGHSQKSFAELLDVSESNIVMIEAGKRQITYGMKTKVAKRFDITPEFLEFYERISKLH